MGRPIYFKLDIMTRFAKSTIPNDWNESTDGWEMAVLCYPNSDQWRVLIRGAIYQLTRGRNWNETTGTIIEAQNIALEILESLDMGCNVNLGRIADALEQVREILGPINPPHQMLDFVQHLEVLGNIPGAGDTIQQSLWKVVDRMPTDMSIQELIDLLEAQADPNFNDFLQLLYYIKSLLPSLPDLPALHLFDLIGMAFDARHKHTHSVTQVYQATALRGIQNALTAYQESPGDTEQEAVEGIWEELMKTPWLTTAIASLVDPSPAGEIAFVAKMGIVAKSWIDKITSMWATFRDSYVNQVEDPVPVSTVTGQLAEIAARLQNLDTGSSEAGITTLIQALINGLSEIDSTLENDMAITQTNNQVVNCSGGGGCGCSGSEYIPGDDPLPQSDVDSANYDQQTQGEGGSPPDGFDDWDEYNAYKCKAANAMFLGAAETFYQIGDFIGHSFRRGSHAATARIIKEFLDSSTEWQDGQLPDFLGVLKTEGTQLSYMMNAWVAEKIADMYYPSDERPDPFQLFYDARLEWIADRSAIVCDIFNAENTSQVRAAVLSAFGDYVDAMSYDQVYRDWAVSIVSGALTNTWCNLLFENHEHISGYEDSSAVNCGSECIGYHVTWGIDHGNGLVEAFDQGGQFAVEIIVNGSVWSQGPESEVGWSIVSGTVESTDDRAYRVYDGELDLIYEDDDPPTNPQCLRAITMVNDDGSGGSTFTIQFSIGDVC